MGTDSRDSKRPEWQPEDAGAEFACRVMDGVASGHDGISSYQKAAADAASGASAPVFTRPAYTADDYAESAH